MKMLKLEDSALENYVREIMSSLNIPMDEHSKDTPRRLIKMWREVFSSVNKDVMEFKKELTLFPAPPMSYPKGVVIGDNYVCVKDIPFHSMCAHHWLPFFGKCDISYLPNRHIIGLSKLPRVVKFFSKKPQVQENLTAEIGSFLVHVLKPLKLDIKFHDVMHTCVLCRGVESFAETETIWSYTNPNYSVNM